MDRKYIEDMLNAGDCPDGMDERVIAFAAGELKTEAERIEALTHILICDSCRFTYEDYMLMADESDEDADIEIPEIAFRINNNFIIPVTEHISPSAAVLSSGNSRSAEFRVNTDNCDLNILAISTGTGVELSVKCSDDKTQFYLVNPDGYKTAFAYNGTARFEGVKPGKYILSKNMKESVFVEIG